jgi:hypothetical protein
MIIKVKANEFYFCYFENGFENDVFIEKMFGQNSLDNM